MAFKKVLDTTKSTYLNGRFEDEEGNQYSATAAESLISWIRLNRPAPEDLGKNSTTPVYEGTQLEDDFIDAVLGEVTYPAVNLYRSPVSNNTKINISDSNPELYRFSSLESGASAVAGGDNPFSMSMWVKLDDDATGEQTFAEKAGAFTFKIKSKLTSDQKTENAKILWQHLYNVAFQFGSGDYILINVDGTYYGVAFQQPFGDPVDWSSGTLGFSINPALYPYISQIPQSSSWDTVFAVFDSMINSTGVKVSRSGTSEDILFEVVSDTIRGEGTNTSNTNISLLVGNVIDEDNGATVNIGTGSPPSSGAIVSTLDTDFESGINASRAGLQVRIYSSNSDGLFLSTNSDIDDSDNLYASLKNSWNHVAFTYKGGVASSNDDYVKDNLLVYLNGNLIGGKDRGLGFFFTQDDAVPYVSLVPNDSNDLFVGSDSDGSHLLDGSVSEVCVWNSFLTNQDIKAVYNTTKTNFTRNSTYSGFLNHSPRIQSVDNLNYHDVHGKFDDMRTIDFVDPRQEAVIRFNRAPRDAHTVTITDTASSKTKTFEFQRGVVLGAGNVEVNIRGTRTPAQAARKFVQAVNEQTNHNDWTFHAEQTKPNEVKIVRGKIDNSAACTLTLGSNTKERFIEVIKKFAKKPQPKSVYPSLDLAKSVHLAERVNYGSAIRSDIEIVRPVSRMGSVRVANDFSADPFNESHAHASFGFEEGIEGVSPERDQDASFYVSGSASAIGPSGVKNRKRIVLDVPSVSSTELMFNPETGGEIVSAGAFVVGTKYKIVSQGDTVFTDIGSANNTVGTVFTATGAGDGSTTGTASTVTKSPMAYYNVSLSKWEPIGSLESPFSQIQTTSAAVSDKKGQLLKALDRSMIGFTPSHNLNVWATAKRNQTATSTPGTSAETYYGFGKWEAESVNSFRLAKTGSLSFKSTSGSTYPKVISVGSIASPTNVFGFPAHPKFHATGSQEILMSNYIDKPFVLEKVVYEFNLAQFSGSSDANLSSLPNLNSISSDEDPGGQHTSRIVDLDTVTFFLLNQRTAALGTELNSLPEVEVADADSYTRHFDGQVTKTSNPIGSIPTLTQLTPQPIVTAGSFVVGNTYQVVSLGTTVWTSSPAIGESGVGFVNGVEANVGDIFVATAAGSGTGTARDVTRVNVETIRDLITWNRITASPQGFNTGFMDTLAKDVRKEADLVVDATSTKRGFGTTSGGTIKYSIAGSCVAPVVQKSTVSGSVSHAGSVCVATMTRSGSAGAYRGTYVGISSANGHTPLGSQTGQFDTAIPAKQSITLSRKGIGRTLIGIESGRSIGSENPSKKDLYTFRGQKNTDLMITAYESDSESSPYVLLPEDKLILGCQAPIGQDLTSTSQPNITIGSGAGKVIFYGYELSDEKENSRGYNSSSKGSSSFFHEGIGEMSPQDQFETSPRMTYYRSSIDEVVEGPMQFEFTGDNFGPSQQAQARRVVGRNSQGTQGEKGSLLRARKLVDNSERYYDSMTPDISDLMRADNVKGIDITVTGSAGDYSNHVGTAGIALGVKGSDAALKTGLGVSSTTTHKLVWDNWFSSFPFEPRYQAVSTERVGTSRKNISVNAQTGPNLGTSIKKDLSHVSLALFDSFDKLRVVGTTGAGSHKNIGSKTEIGSRQLVSSGSASSMFTNYPPINDSEVYFAWNADPSTPTDSLYGDGDASTEPTDANPEAYSSIVLECNATNAADTETLTFGTLAGVSYSAAVDATSPPDPVTSATIIAKQTQLPFIQNCFRFDGSSNSHVVKTSCSPAQISALGSPTTVTVTTTAGSMADAQNTNDVQFTVGMWIKVADLDSQQTLFSKWSGGSEYIVYIQTDGRIRLHIRGSKSSVRTRTDPADAATDLDPNVYSNQYQRTDFESPTHDGTATGNHILESSDIGNWVHIAWVHKPQTTPASATINPASAGSDGSDDRKIQFYKNGVPHGSVVDDNNDSYNGAYLSGGGTLIFGAISTSSSPSSRFRGDLSSFVMMKHDGDSPRSATVPTHAQVYDLYDPVKGQSNATNSMPSAPSAGSDGSQGNQSTPRTFAQLSPYGNPGNPGHLYDYKQNLEPLGTVGFTGTFQYDKRDDIVLYYKFNEVISSESVTQVKDYSGGNHHIDIATSVGSGVTSVSSGVGAAALYEIGIDAITDESFATEVKKSIDLAFASLITAGVARTSIEENSATPPKKTRVKLEIKNSYHVNFARPTIGGTLTESSRGVHALGDNTKAPIWTGSDLTKVLGGIIKRQSVLDATKGNHETHLETVKFASIVGKNLSNVSRNVTVTPAEAGGNDTKTFNFGSSINEGTDDTQKVFFGSGAGPSKSPKYNLQEPSALTIPESVTIKLVTHGHSGSPNPPSALDPSFASNFTFDGVGTGAIVIGSGASGDGVSVRAGESLVDFSGAGTRELYLNTEIQAGQIVFIRYSAFTVDASVSPGPNIQTSFGQPFENADGADNDDGVRVQVSIDGGDSYVDAHTLFTCLIDGGGVNDSLLFTPGASTRTFTSNFLAANNKNNDPFDGSGNPHYTEGADPLYPLFQFTATQNCKIRLKQTNWSGLSVSYDHWAFRYLAFGIKKATGVITPISPRGNFNQTAIASGIELRGAKYGLASPVNLKTSSIFRAGSFGQCRDMLEQRKFTRTFNGTEVSDAPVTVNFQERKTKRNVEPEETNSSNLDLFCTSSIPYFDGLNRDRTSQQPDLLDKIDIDIQV